MSDNRLQSKHFRDCRKVRNFSWNDYSLCHDCDSFKLYTNALVVQNMSMLASDERTFRSPRRKCYLTYITNCRIVPLELYVIMSFRRWPVLFTHISYVSWSSSWTPFSSWCARRIVKSRFYTSIIIQWCRFALGLASNSSPAVIRLSLVSSTLSSTSSCTRIIC